MLQCAPARAGGRRARPQHPWTVRRSTKTYACADGGFITVGAIEPQFHALLLDRLGLADAASVPGPAVGPRSLGLRRRAQLQALFASRPRAHWQQLLEAGDCLFRRRAQPCGKQPATRTCRARGVYLQPEGGALQASPAPRFDGQAYAPWPCECRRLRHRQRAGEGERRARAGSLAQRPLIHERLEARPACPRPAHQRDQARPGIAFQRAALRAVDGQGDREHPVTRRPWPWTWARQWTGSRGAGRRGAAAKAVLGQVAPRSSSRSRSCWRRAGSSACSSAMKASRSASGRLSR